MNTVVLIACALSISSSQIHATNVPNWSEAYNTPYGTVHIHEMSHSDMQNANICNKPKSHPRYGEPCYGYYRKDGDFHYILLSDAIPKSWGDGVLVHELGHIKVGPSDEYGADKIMKRCMKAVK